MLVSKPAKVSISSMAYTLMVQGTTSDAGKSVLVAGLCRVLANRGKAVAPFKPQNMALNSAVTVDGGEIGRAQALQAQACFLDAHSDMNPVLLKPSSDIGAQVIIHGKALSHLDARQFHDYKKFAMGAVLESHQRLSDQFQYIIVEGAGSPAEINLRHNDIANMGFAEAVDCPVILIADIDRGGVFAHLIGTLNLLSESEQQRIVGFVINKFRGDLSLLQSGLDFLEERTGKPVLGVLPYIQGMYLDAEDAINSEQLVSSELPVLKVIVPVLSRISNHTDFDVLRLHPQVDLQFIGPEQPIPHCDLMILPGSKNVRADLQWLKNNGWVSALERHLRYGGKVLGICGGYQMLGQQVDDLLGVEGPPGTSSALGLLDIYTEIKTEKQLKKVSGRLAFGNSPVEGYEIHCGSSRGAALGAPLVHLEGGGADGAISDDNLIAGSYIHGLFDNPEACASLLNWAGLEQLVRSDANERREQDIERLATTIERHLDLSVLIGIDNDGELIREPAR